MDKIRPNWTETKQKRTETDGKGGKHTESDGNGGKHTESDGNGQK